MSNTILKTLIFIVMCTMGTLCLIIGLAKYLSSSNEKKGKSIPIITSIILGLINTTGCLLIAFIGS